MLSTALCGSSSCHTSRASCVMASRGSSAASGPAATASGPARRHRRRSAGGACMVWSSGAARILRDAPVDDRWSPALDRCRLWRWGDLCRRAVPSAATRASPRLVRASLLVAVIVAGFLVAVAVSRADEAKKPGAVVVLSRADAGVSVSSAAGAQPAPYLWLEGVHRPRSMDWVRAHNAATAKKLESQPIYKELYANALAAPDPASRLPAVTQRGRWIYNFWQDDKHPRGSYRRAT